MTAVWRKPLVMGANGVPQEIASTDGLLTPGGLGGGSGAGAPTVSAGTLVAGSTDLRGGVTLVTSLLTAVVTFALPFATTPWVQLTTSVAGTAAAVTARSATSFTVAVSTNLASVTVYWECLE